MKYVLMKKCCQNIHNIGCVNIHGAHLTANTSINNNIVFFFVSELKIVYYNNH